MCLRQPKYQITTRKMGILYAKQGYSFLRANWVGELRLICRIRQKKYNVISLQSPRLSFLLSSDVSIHE